ncbi:MAG TPA: LysR family transcriptional regulator [Candidatus Borkfalkia faecavium]|uniref:LysR family transcriptional regulator n=1 Tax=Candidatus Borkfalkia faecavium TaxID=2838508 RepID=A0A9D1W1R0_9FIRM|nr:LysR family transcriptional regulator [Candidatus Borkfalkia faecavium]
MNSDGIKTFIMLSKLKNFTRTAERMYVAQSTVTNRIAELENETGQKLFVRRQGGVELTEEGQLFLSYALRINDLEESFIQEVNSAARYEKQLRVGCINAVYESSLFPLLSRFFSDNQDVSLKVVLGHSADLLQMLQDSIIDVAFSYLPFKKAGFTSRRFSQDRLLLLASPAANAFRGGIRKQELASCEYLMCNFAFGDAGEFVRSLFPPRHAFRFEVDNSGKVIEYLLAGLDYSFLPAKMAERELKEGKLEAIRPLDFAVPELISYCAFRRGNALAEALLAGK